MGENSNELVVLASVPTEAEAVMIVAALEAEGIEAKTIGALTSGFRALVTGDVEVVVRKCDLDRARKTLRRNGENAD